MHPYKGKVYNPNRQSLIKNLRYLAPRYLQLLYRLLGIAYNPLSLIIHFVDFVNLMRCMGSTGGNRLSALGEVTSAFLVQL